MSYMPKWVKMCMRNQLWEMMGYVGPSEDRSSQFAPPIALKVFSNDADDIRQQLILKEICADAECLLAMANVT